MKRYIGYIMESTVGPRTMAGLKRLCKLESASNPEQFKYGYRGETLKVAFTESAMHDLTVAQLKSMFEGTDAIGKLFESEYDDESNDATQEYVDTAKLGKEDDENTADAEGSESETVADGTGDTQSDEIKPGDAEASDDDINGTDNEQVAEDNKDPIPENRPATNKPNIYEIPPGFDVSDDMGEFFSDLVITDGITDSDHPLFNLRHPVMREIIRSKNPDADCPEYVKLFKDAINSSKSAVLKDIFGANMGGWLSVLSPFLSKAYEANDSRLKKIAEFRNKFANLWNGSESKTNYTVTTAGKTAARIMQDILNKNGQTKTFRNRIAIATSTIPDINKLAEIGNIGFYELSETGKFNPNKPSGTISGPELAQWYQYVNPYASAATYMKYLDFSKPQDTSKQVKQDAQAAADIKPASSKDNYKDALNNNALQYLIFSPKRALRECDMISNGVIKGTNNSYHALTMCTTSGSVVGFYTEDEIKSRFN